MSKIRFASEEYVNKVMPAAPNWGAATGEPGHIENRTHWSEPEKVTIIEETTTPVFHESIMNVPAYNWVPIGEDFRTLCSKLIEPGMTYLVTVDGVEYESIAYEVSGAYYEYCVVIGDSRLFYEHYGESDGLSEEVASLNPQDVPFAVVNIIGMDGLIPESINYDNSISTITIPEDAVFKLENLTGNNTYHTLDKNYLPMDDIYEGIMSRMAIAEEASF